MFRSFHFCAALVICAAVHGQSAAPPPEVDAALRERASQFFQLQADGQFRKAEALVAEESKDTYYNSDRARFVRFKLDSIQYSDDFTRAKVKTLMGLTVNSPFFVGKVIDMPSVSDWKVEDGKWCWFLEPKTTLMTPFGEVKVQAEKAGDPGGGGFHIPDTADFALGKTKLERDSIELKSGHSAELSISNSAQGPVSVSVLSAPDGITVTPKSANVPSITKVALTVKAGATAKGGEIRLEVSPSGEILTAKVAIQ